MFEEKKVEMELAGRKLTMETGKIARQASGSVIVKYGETTLLATAVGEKKPKEGADFFPLTVDFVEKMYASGKIPGGFIKREARPSTQATLTARMIDRPIRPLFPEGFNHGVHIVITVLSYDGESTPDYLGIIGASAAISISDLPFAGPVAGVVIGYQDGEFILNPTPEQLIESEIELTVAGTKDAVTMVEAGANEASEELMLDAIMFGHEKIKEICELQEKLKELAGKPVMEYSIDTVPEDIVKFVEENSKEKLKEAVNTKGKEARDEKVNAVEDEMIDKYKAENEDSEELDKNVKYIKKYYHDLMKKLVREAILYNKFRVDGRGLEDIRDIDVDIDLLEIPHGSALFTRGETQAFVLTTLGTKMDEQIVDGLDVESRKKFYLHYNFPPYCVGEAGFMRGPGRRELGHGALAERALSYVLPDPEEFPYTVRVVSEITESNGSSSMASVCGGSLSLMAAGVPTKSSVAGIAMGLIKEGDDYVVLTDIMGLEDHLGDMDFKVAGTKEGITALQMDIKIEDLSKEIMVKALEQALKARTIILGKMDAVISAPKEEMSPRVPRMATLMISKDKISELIGPGGKNIKGIIEKTESKVDIDDEGKVVIFSENQEKLDETLRMVKECTLEVEVGEVYKGKVVKIMNFGAFVAIPGGKEGLVHISELDTKRVKNVEDVLSEGDELDVKVIKKDKEGKISLSRKALLSK